MMINSAEDWAQPFQREALATESFILCFGSKVHPPCPEQQQVCHSVCAGFAAATEAGITHPEAPDANVLLSLGWQSQELQFRLLEMPMCGCHARPGTGTGFLWGCVSQLTAPAELCVHWSNWSLRSCIFWWGPESGTASLHLPHHSPSSHLWGGNVCTWGQVQRLLAASESSQEEMMPGAHRAAP